MRFIVLYFFIFFNPLFSLFWGDLANKEKIYLYAGDVPSSRRLVIPKLVGLSLNFSDSFHIKHDITKPFELPSNSVDFFQAEDVMEHIEYEVLPSVINEIFRVLKPGGLFRFSVPDYRCDILYKRSIKSKDGKIIFDPGGGGRYVNNKVIDGGHLWFPIIEKVENLFNQTRFFKLGSIKYLHFYNKSGESITNKIDYKKGFISRTPDNDKRVKNPYRVLSIVVDLYK